MATRTATSTTSVVVDIDTTGEVQFKRAAITGDVAVAANANTATIGANIVTNAKSAQMAADTVKANNTGSTGNAADVGMATSTVLGRGPTGHIDDLIVDSSLSISDTGLGRAALTGAITASAGSNTTALAADAVTTASILDANVTTAKIALNAVGNQRAAQMPTNTLKGNATTITGNQQDLTLLGGLSMDGTSKVKAKSSIALNYLFDTQTTTTDPGSTKCNFNAAKTSLVVSDASLGGRNIADLMAIVNGGAVHYQANDATGTAWGQFRVTGATSDVSGLFHTFQGALVTGLDTVPADGAEIILYYVGVDNATDVENINKALNVVTHNALNQLLNKDEEVISGTPVVANQAALPDVGDYDGFGYRVDNQGLYGIDYQANGVWSPTNGSFLLDMWTNPGDDTISYIFPADTWNGAYTLSTAAAGAETLITGAGAEAHGLTSAVAVGKYIYVSAGTNMVGAHRITAVAVDTTGTTIQIAKTYNAANTITDVAIVGDLIPVRTITIPALRIHSSVHVNLDLVADTLHAGPLSRFTHIVWGGVSFYKQNYSSVTNDYLPASFRISNCGNLSKQRASGMLNSTGYVSSGTSATPVTGAFSTAAETTLVISYESDTPNIPMEYAHGEIYIRG